MKIQIRRNVFETNSSSTHSCSVARREDYANFNLGKVWYKQEDDSYLPIDEAIENNVDELKENYDYKLTDEQWEKFKVALKETKTFSGAFEAIGIPFKRWDIDPDAMYLSENMYWSYNDYEQWSHYFTDSAGTDMVAWGYMGFD